MANADQSVRNKGLLNLRGNPAARLVVFALFYFAAVELGLTLIARPEGIAMFWPAGGVALAILLLRPRREWWTILAMIFVVNTLANFISGNSIIISLGFALGNTLEPALGGWVMSRLRREPITFTRAGDILALIIVATLANAVTASLGALVPTLGFGAEYVDAWAIWLIPDGMGIMLVTPFIITWVTDQPRLEKPSLAWIFELIFWFLVVSLSAWLMFGVKGLHIRLEPRPYMLYPFLLWGALRFTPRVSATGLVLISAISLGCTVAGIGSVPLGGQILVDQVLAVQAFFFVAGITLMLLTCIFAERKQAGAELKRSEERFRALVENGADAVTLVGADGRVLYEGPTTERITGHRREDRIGRSGFETIYPDDLPAVQKVFAGVLANPGGSQTTQFRAVRKDGTIWWAEGTATNLLNDPRAGGIVINYRDITMRKRAEEELQESRKRLQDVVNAAPYGAHTYELHPDGRLVFIGANRSADSILGVDNQQFIGRTIEEAFPPLAETEIPEAYRRVAATGEAYYQEQVTYNEQGISGAFEVHGLQISPNVMTAFFQDVTERKRIETERERLFGELERKNKEQETLIYVASHDLRSPLVNIQGFGKNLQKYFGQISDILGNAGSLEEGRSSIQPILTEKIPSALRFIETSSIKMDGLIDGLLRLSRIGRTTLQMIPVDVSAMIQTILDAMAFQIEKAHARVEVIRPLAGCVGDRNLLNQVFSNLIDNAIKYCAPDRPLAITISSQVEPDTVTYTIADTGLGIAAEDKGKIWEIFHRLGNREDIPGEGLGLTIAQRILERHHGRIWVESELGSGSRFHVQLPRKG